MKRPGREQDDVVMTKPVRKIVTCEWIFAVVAIVAPLVAW
jgi:hypothetical protein